MGEERISAGFGGMSPQGITLRFSTLGTGRMEAKTSRCPVRDWTKPGLFSTPVERWQDGRRMSQSTITTLLPRLARVTPRLTVTVVLPSPGSALVMRIDFGTGGADSRMEVRSERKASSAAGLVTMAGVAGPTPSVVVARPCASPRVEIRRAHV